MTEPTQAQILAVMAELEPVLARIPPGQRPSILVTARAIARRVLEASPR